MRTFVRTKLYENGLHFLLTKLFAKGGRTNYYCTSSFYFPKVAPAF